MGKIIAIIGESGAGKSFLAKTLKEKYEGKLSILKSFTTRPMRDSEKNRFDKDSLDHIFISDEEMDQINKKDMIAYTKFGKYRYCATKDQLTKNTIYIIDDKGLEELRKNFDVDDILTIRLYTKENVRLNRTDPERVNRGKDNFFLDSDNYDVIIDTDSFIVYDVKQGGGEYFYNANFTPISGIVKGISRIIDRFLENK